MPGSVDRAIVFVDGNNFYHGCERLGLSDLGALNYARVSTRLVGPRQWIATRYYVGRVPKIGNLSMSARQERFFTFLLGCDPRISLHLGRIEPRPAKSLAAQELASYLAGLKIRIDGAVFRDLISISRRHAMASVLVEKAVDVQLAIDMVVMAVQNEYDTAYLLSADGDLSPAVEAASAIGKSVFVASAQSGSQLAKVCKKFLPLKTDWFTGLFGA